MAKQYELMLVLVPDFAHDDKKKREDAVRSLVGSDVTIKDVAVIGKKPLAYPIRKQNEGVYLQATLESEAMHVSDIQKRAKLKDDVLRYLLTQKGTKDRK